MPTPAPAQLVLSGVVFPGKRLFVGVGDVTIHPGSGRTPYIDANVFDGVKWRALDLMGFGFNLRSRNFGDSDEIGPLMRQIKNKIEGCKGSIVYYDSPVGSGKRKYIYRGMSYSSFMQRGPWFPT